MRREGREACSIAAAYLYEFIEDGTQWVHLDVVVPGGAEKIRKAFGKGRDWRLYGGGVSVPGTGIKDWHLHRASQDYLLEEGKYEVRF